MIGPIDMVELGSNGKRLDDRDSATGLAPAQIESYCSGHGALFRRANDRRRRRPSAVLVFLNDIAQQLLISATAVRETGNRICFSPGVQYEVTNYI